MLRRYDALVSAWNTLVQEVHRGEQIVPTADDDTLPCPAVRRTTHVRVRDELSGIWSSVPVLRLRVPLDGVIEGDVVWVGATKETATAYVVKEAPEARDGLIGRSLAKLTISEVGGRA